MTNDKSIKRAAPYFAIIVAAFGVYLNSLGYSFTYDDHHYIVESGYIRGWTKFFSIFEGAYFSHPPEALDLTRPLMPFSLTADFVVWGLNPFGYRLTNIFLHALNSILVYILAKQILSDGWVSLAAALIFAVHPIHAEPVIGITFREDLLVTLFYLSSLIFYIRFAKGAGRANYILSVFTFFLALLSKEMAVTLPFILYCYAYLFGGKGAKRAGLYHYLPYWGILPFYFYFLYLVYSGLPNPPGYAGSIMATPHILAAYLKLLLFPLNLSVDYNLISYNFPEVIFFTTILFVLLRYAVASRDKAIFFGMIFFIITLLPVMNIIPTFRLIADRFLYLPSVGFCILMASLLFKCRQKLGGVPLMHKVIAVIILGFYLLIALNRGGVWRNDFTLWSDALKKNPLSVRAYTAIGAYYINEGNDDSALKMLQKAVEIRPDYDKGYYNIGAIYLKRGYIDAAITVLRKAVEINPDYAKAHFNLGLALAKKGDYDEAIEEYEKALNSMSANALVYNNIGNAYSAKDLYDKALLVYEKAVSIDPYSADAYYNMANGLAKLGRYDEALKYYEKAIALNPGHSSAYFNMGNVYLQLGRKEKAISAYEAAVKADPRHQGASDAMKEILK